MDKRRRFAKSGIFAALLPFALILLAAASAMAADLSGSYSWKPVKIGAGGFLRGMVVHPTNSNVRYVRGDVDDIYRWDSTNNIWMPMKVFGTLPSNVTAAPAAAGGGAIALDPNNANIVLCAYTFKRSADITGTYPNINLNVYRSTDGGLTFAAGNMSLAGDISAETRGERLRIDPNNGNVVYFGSPSNGLWRSMDGGLTWTNVTANGAPASNSNAVIPWIDKGAGTVSFGGQTVSKRIYILMNFGPILMSNDGGNSWTNISDVEYTGKNVICSTLDQNGNLYVGDIPNYGQIAKYTRAGVWSSIANPPQGNTGIAVDPTNASRMFVIGGGANGLGRSLDGGATWTRLGATPNYSTTQEIQWLRPSAIRPNGHFESTSNLCMDPTGRLWVPGGNDGVITFMPNDAVDSDTTPPTWVSNSQGIEEMVGHAITIPPGGNPILTFEDEGPFTVFNPDVFTAQHHSLNYWDPANTPHNGLSEGQDVAYCPNQPHFVVATSDNGGYGVEPVLSGQFFSGYSTDGGNTWSKFASITAGTHPCPLYCGLIAVSPRASGHQNDGPGADKIVWAPGDVVNTITAAPFYSTDGGAHWTQTASFNGTTGASTVNKCGVNYTYLGFQCGTWSNLIHQHLLEADPLIPGTFYYQPTNLGFWKSTDGGVTWVQQTATGLPTATHQAQLRANPNASGDLWFVDGYEGASAHGLWHTTNSGASFTQIGAFDYAWQLALGKASGSYPAIFVYGKMTGDANWGVFRSVDQGVTWDRISYYPYGLIDEPGGMSASWDTFGQVYISFQGSSAVYGTPSGGSPPPAPTGLTATAGNAQVGLSWTASSGATSYNALRSTVSGSGYASVATGIATTSYTNTGLTNGTTYYFVVTATNASGTSGNSNQASATPTASGDTTQYNFESGTQNWGVSLPGTIASSTAKAYLGTHSLAYTSNATGAGTTGISIGGSPGPGTPAGATVTYHVWIPTGSPLTNVTVYLQGGAPNYTWTGNSYPIASLTAGAWNTLTVTCPASGSAPLGSLGLQCTTNAAWNGTVYVDSIDWPAGSPPAAPTGLTATAGNAQVALSWTASSGATSYNVKRSTVSGSGYAQVTNVTTTSYTNTGLTNGTTYYFVVTALNAGGESGNSAQASATPTAIPAAPTGLVATPGNTQVALTWNASSGATAYDVKRSTVSGSGYATVSSPTVTNYTNTGLANGTTYYFVVDAKNASGTSANSSQVSATPTGPPSAPTGLAATPGNAQVSLSWTASSGATSYNALRSTVSGSGYASVATGIATTSYTNTGLTNGTTYYFVVTATNASGTSGNSNQAGATPVAPPAAPTTPIATPGNAQVSFSWTASTGASSYNVKRSTVSGSGYAQVANVSTTSYTNTGLTNGTMYYFVVSALNAGGESANTVQSSAEPSTGDATQYNFESGTQNWGATLPDTITSSTAKAFLGTHSLAFTINGSGAETTGISIGGSPGPATPAGATVTYHVWIPTGSLITKVTPYLQGGSPNYTWTGNAYLIANLTAGAWNTLTVTCPASGSAPLGSLGLQVTISAAWTGTVYLDSVNW